MLRLPQLPPTAIRGPRAMPLLGVTGNFMRFFGDPVGRLLALHRDHGTLVALADKNAAVVCAFSPAHNRQILSDPQRFHNFAEALFPLPDGHPGHRLAHALTAQNGDVHRRNRRLLMPAFTKAALDGYRQQMVRLARECAAQLRPGDTRDLAAEMTTLSLRIALNCLYGVDVTDGEHLGSLAKKYLAGLISPLAMLLPYQLPGLPYRRFLDTAERLEARLAALIAERRAHPSSSKDMLSILLASHGEDGATLSDDELMGQATVMFIAGHETTAFTLTWTLLLLAQHPAVLGDLLDEIDAVVGDADPTPAHLERLVLLDRVLKESQRLLPASAWLFIRRAQEPFRLDEHELPAQTSLLLSPIVTHRLPELYADPLRFDPRRWERVDPSPYEYLPFGAGPRLCIGASFAAQALRLTLPILLRRFAPALTDGTRVDRKVQGITMGPKHALPMKLLPRDQPLARPARLRGDLHELVRFDA